MTTTVRQISVIVALVLGTAGSVAGGQGPAARAARDARTLHDRVPPGASHLDEAVENGDLPVASLDELAGRAPVVIVGRVLQARTRLTSDGRGLATELAVSVQARMKGPVPPGQLIYIRVPGGKHRFPDGRTVNQFVPGFRSPQTGGLCVLYLRPIAAAAAGNGRASGAPTRLPHRAAYELAAGPQGMFVVDAPGDRVVPAAVNRSHPLAARFANVTVTDFLSEVSRSILR
jgi:hypothetical protein